MGSIEVYDYKQMKWVPYVPDPDSADRYYQKMKAKIEEKSNPGYVMKKLQDTEEKLRDTERKLDEAEAKLKRGPTVKLVTPVAQGIEMVKSEVKRVKKQNEKVEENSDPITDWTKLKY